MPLPLRIIAALALGTMLPAGAFAAGESILYRTDHFLFTIPSDDIEAWTSTETAWTYGGRVVVPPSFLLADGDRTPVAPPGFRRITRQGYSLDAIQSTLRTKISDIFDRPAGSVVIRQTSTGAIVFEGVGLPGRTVDLHALAELTVQALERGITDIDIPVIETPPEVTVDAALEEQGIREVVTVGESTYAGSPVNRRHNIATGLARFNGHLIRQGETFSFNAILGPVDDTTNYRKELVIKGDRTVPDYGGGLCQVSTTAYRGVWEYGFPIVSRINHSYAVSYYGPQGTDATVYPPFPDMSFVNDSPAALLIQTYHDEHDHAYFIYYGTKDARTSSVFGPFIWGRTAAPPDRTIITRDLPLGQKRKIGDRHPGMSAAWLRTVTLPDGRISKETTVSIYQARPLFYEVGGDPAVAPSASDPLPPEDVNTEEPPRAF